MNVDLSQYRQDARGNLIPIANIKEIDLLRDELVQSIFANIMPKVNELKQAKEQAIGDVRAFVDLSAEKYDVKPSKKGNITLYSFDGKQRVTVAMQDVLVFDERLQAAKALIDECLNEWTENSRAELKIIVQQAFDVNKEGKISVSKVLGLRRLDIQDEKWQRAMAALADSVHTQATREYIRLHLRDEKTGEYVLVSADFGKV